MNLFSAKQVRDPLFLLCALVVLAFAATPPLANAALPDNRAWEMVSPLDKNGGEVLGIDGVAEGGVVQASEDGSKVTYLSFSSFAEPEGAPFANQYLSTRGEKGWETQSLGPNTSQNEYSLISDGGPYKAFSGDLSQGLLIGGQFGELPGEPTGYEDFRIRNDQTAGVMPLITSTPLGAGGKPLTGGLKLSLVSSTDNLGHILVESPAALTPNAQFDGEFKANDYEWSDGKLEVVNILPGAPHNESTPNRETLAQKEHEMSNDGSRVFWSSNATGVYSLYVRENVGQPPSPLDGEGKCLIPADACSVQIDASQVAGVEGGRGEYQGASSDGSRAFFLDNFPLTSESNSPRGEVSSNSDLYEFNVPKGELHDLTTDRLASGEPNPEDPGGASVMGVLGISQDGSYVYFAANGVLTHIPNPRGESATHGTCVRNGGSSAQFCNLYLDHEGTITYITRLTSSDGISANGSIDWKAESLYYRTTRVSPDGKGLVPSTATFAGEGNLPGAAVKPAVKAKKAKPKAKPCRRGQVRKKGRCVRRAAVKRAR